jgi:translation initiation factor 1
MSDEKKPFHTPFAALAGLRDGLPKGPEPQPNAKVPSPQGPPRAVVRIERAGRRGKEVTIIEQLALSRREREAWLTALKGALGCGGTLDGDDLVLQGDHRQRAAKWLEARGVKKVTVGA